MTTHRLKVLIKYADAIMNGTKTFEVRKNDRGYEVGDMRWNHCPKCGAAIVDD